MLAPSMEFFRSGAELSLKSVNSVNLGNLIDHLNMNWDKFKDPISHMCLAGVGGSIPVSYTRGGKFKPFYCNDKYFCH